LELGHTVARRASRQIGHRTIWQTVGQITTPVAIPGLLLSVAMYGFGLVVIFVIYRAARSDNLPSVTSAVVWCVLFMLPIAGGVMLERAMAAENNGLQHGGKLRWATVAAEAATEERLAECTMDTNTPSEACVNWAIAAGKLAGESVLTQLPKGTSSQLQVSIDPNYQIVVDVSYDNHDGISAKARSYSGDPPQGKYHYNCLVTGSNDFACRASAK
jgi:hypothetical protein